ncbi:MAG: HlyD family secretion protein [Pararhizobium sp.]
MSREDQPLIRADDEEASATIRPFPARQGDKATQAPSARRTAPVPDAEPAVEPAAPAAEPHVEETRKKRGLRGLLLPIIGAALLAGGAYYGYDYWTVGRFMVSTDDAYVHGDIAAIAPKITGYVDTINFQENQRVKAGDVLVRLDDGDYRIALDQAKAKIVSQQKTLDRIKAQIAAGGTSVAQAEADKLAAEATLRNAEASAKRARSLLATKFAAQSTVDDAEAALDFAKAKLTGTEAAIAAAKANIEVLKGQYGEAESQMRTLQLGVAQAKRDLDMTVLRAPYDGIVGNRAVERGDLVSPGQNLAAIVPVHGLYIEANLKETQLAKVVAGEKATVAVDAFDGNDIEGTVSSISPASGAVFSLLPAENATGNFTKVVQRVPVRIDLPKSVLESGKLRAGLSVVVDIDTRTAPDAAKAAK